MAYRKKTLKQLNPTARKLGKAIGKMQSALNDFKKIIDAVNIAEAEVIRLSRALSFLQKPRLSDLQEHLKELKDKAI